MNKIAMRIWATATAVVTIAGFVILILVYIHDVSRIPFVPIGVAVVAAGAVSCVALFTVEGSRRMEHAERRYLRRRDRLPH